MFWRRQASRSSGQQGPLHPKLEEFDLLIANNHHLEGWPERRKERAAEFIRDGGGFLLIAGENSLYIEHEEDDTGSAARRAPRRAGAAPHARRHGGRADPRQVFFHGRQEDGAGAAVGDWRGRELASHRPGGRAGFDNSFEWTVPLRQNDDPESIKQLITSIIADGGTQIAPALNEGFRRIQPAKAAYRHILLLTDGISEEGDSIALAREAAAKAKVTISTIGLGQDVNRAYLERVARTAEGEPHFLLDISALTQLGTAGRDGTHRFVRGGDGIYGRKSSSRSRFLTRFRLRTPARCWVGSSSSPSRKPRRSCGPMRKTRCWCAGNMG